MERYFLNENCEMSFQIHYVRTVLKQYAASHYSFGAKFMHFHQIISFVFHHWAFIEASVRYSKYSLRSILGHQATPSGISASQCWPGQTMGSWRHNAAMGTRWNSSWTNNCHVSATIDGILQEASWRDAEANDTQKHSRPYSKPIHIYGFLTWLNSLSDN